MILTLYLIQRILINLIFCRLMRDHVEILLVLLSYACLPRAETFETRRPQKLLPTILILGYGG